MCARKTPKYITAFPYVGEPTVILGNSSQCSLKTAGVLSFQRASLEKTRATPCLCRHALFREGAQGPAVHPHPTSPAPLSPVPSAHSLPNTAALVLLHYKRVSLPPSCLLVRHKLTLGPRNAQSRLHHDTGMVHHLTRAFKFLHIFFASPSSAPVAIPHRSGLGTFQPHAA